MLVKIPQDRRVVPKNCLLDQGCLYMTRNKMGTTLWGRGGVQKCSAQSFAITAWV